MVQVGYLPSPPTQPISTKIGMGCPVADLINRAKFQLDRFRGFRATDGQKSLSPIDLRHHPYDSYALPCYTVIERFKKTNGLFVRTFFCIIFFNFPQNYILISSLARRL